MVYCIQAHLVFADAVTRDARLAQAEGAVGSRQRWDVTELRASEWPDANAIYLSVRYVAKNDQLSVDAAMRQLDDVLPGSWIDLHDCPHDESRGKCPKPVRSVF